MEKYYDLFITIQYISIIGLFTECLIVFLKWKTRLHGYLFLNCISTLICSLGFVVASQAKNEDAYISAIQLSYAGRAFIGFALFLFLVNLCHIYLPKWFSIFLVCSQAAIYSSILTMKEHSLYYKNIRFGMSGSFPVLRHDNGIMHHFFTLLMIFYIISGIGMLIYRLRHEKRKTARKRLNMVMTAIMVESAFYTIQITGILPITKYMDLNIIGFPTSTIFMFIAIFKYNLLGTDEIIREFMIDRLPEAIIAVNTEGMVEYFNEPAKRLYPDLSLSSGTIPDDITDALLSDSSITINDHIYTPEENSLIYKGECYGTLYALVDDTEHIRYMQELEKQKRLADSANHAKSAFLANMSHDIRTPINAVLGMNEMILRECEDEDIIGYSEKISRAGNTLLGLINDILDLSKIEAGKLEIIPVDYDLASMLNDLINMIKPRAESKELAFETDICSNTPRMLHGDEIRLKQIITNILTNAVKYTEKGTVKLSVSFNKINEDSIDLDIKVSDTGIGIKQEDIPKLFAKFDRIDEARNRNIEGTGLGMNITSQLLSMMGSHVDVESEYGKGSVFSFTVAQKVVKWEALGDIKEALSSSIKSREKYHERFTAPTAEILVIDDTPMNLEVFVSLLKKTLVNIDTAESGDGGIELASKKKYDIIFLDHMMPLKDGIQTLKELREKKDLPNISTPIVCLTANAVSGSREKYLSAGFNDYLTKPIEPDKLEKMLMDYLPPEKVNIETAEQETGSSESIIPTFIYDIKEIDTSEGMRYNGSENAYLHILETYASSVSGQCSEIENYWKTRSIEDMTVKIHGLKSTSRVIGATGLGALAQQLEDAGRSGDTDFLNAHIDELLSRCRKLSEQLAPLIQHEEDKPLITDEELNEAYTLISEFLSVDDYDSMLQIIESLNDYSYPESEKDKCEAIKKAAENFDYDNISKIMK